MRAPRLVWIFLTFLQYAYAIKKPTTPEALSEVQYIQDLLKEAQTIQEDIDSKQTKRNLERKHGGSDDAAVDERKQEIKQLKDRQLIIYDKAIHHAIKAYDLAPARPVGRLVTGDEFMGRIAHWIPVYGDLTSYWALDSNGDSVEMPTVSEGAITRRDGSITLTQEVFKSPGFLAAVILHETVHFEQKTTKGRGDHIDPLQIETEAYMAIFHNAETLGLTQTEIKDVFARFRWTVKNLPESSADKLAGSETDLYRDIDRLRSVSAETKESAQRSIDGDAQEYERMRREDGERARQAIAEEETAHRAAYHYIKTAAGLACSDPHAFKEEIQAGAVIGAGIDALYLSTYVSEDQNEVGWKSLGVRLNACQKEMLDKVIAAQGPVPSRQLLLWAVEFRRVHPTLLKKFTTSLGEFFESLGKVAESRSNSARRESRDGRSSEQGRSEGSRVPDRVKGSAFQQLRGLAGN